MTSGRWTSIRVSRITAAFALAVLVGTNLYFAFHLAPPLGPPEPSAQELITWTKAHQQQLLFQFVPAYVALLYAVLVALLVNLTRGGGVLAVLAYVGAGANFAVTLVGFGLFFGLRGPALRRTSRAPRQPHARRRSPGRPGLCRRGSKLCRNARRLRPLFRPLDIRPA